MIGLIINHDSSYIKKLENLFDECDTIHYKEFDKNIANKYDYIILSGGDINISGPNDILKEKEFLNTTKKPILGICLGHQLLGILNGSTLRYNKLKEFNESSNGFKFTNILNNKLKMFYFHKCYIDDISDNFEITLEENEGVIFISLIEDKKRKIMGIQSHPEMSGTDGVFIKNYFLNNYI